MPGMLSKPKIDLALFNLESDPSETKNLAARNPEVVSRLEALAEKARVDFGDSAGKRKGTGVREPGRVDL